MTEDEMVGGITDSMDMSLGKLWEMVKGRDAWHAAIPGTQRVRHDLATEQQQGTATIHHVMEIVH